MVKFEALQLSVCRATLSCNKCGRGLFLPLPEITPGGYDLTGRAPVCSGCQFPEQTCDCEPIGASRRTRVSNEGRPDYPYLKADKLSWAIALIAILVTVIAIGWFIWVVANTFA